MTKIYYASIDMHCFFRLKLWAKKKLSKSDYDYICAKKNKIDIHRSFLGRFLLLSGLKDNIDITDLKSLWRIETGKLYLKGQKNVDFNISHSGSIVICIISFTSIVGIDIEQVCSKLDFTMFYPILSFEEICYLKNAPNPSVSFYKIWTMKESIAKAKGLGLNENLKMYSVTRLTDNFRLKKWHINCFTIADDKQEKYIISVASNSLIQIEKKCISSEMIKSVLKK